MKRLITIFALIAALAIPASSFAQAAPYAWTVSTSNADPFANTGAITGLTAYLWLACVDLPAGFVDGIAAAEFDVVTTGGGVHIANVPQNGFLNAGTLPSNMLLAVGACPTGPVLAMNMLISGSTPNTVITLAPSAGGTKGCVDCSPNPQLWPMDWIGLNDPGKGDPCNFVSVEEQSWGAIKGLYR